VTTLEEALKPYRQGRCGVAVHYTGDAGQAALQLGDAWTVRPTRELLDRLGQLVGRDGWRLIYGPRLDG
jgi:hypothetical protein